MLSFLTGDVLTYLAGGVALLLGLVGAFFGVKKMGKNEAEQRQQVDELKNQIETRKKVENVKTDTSGSDADLLKRLRDGRSGK